MRCRWLVILCLALGLALAACGGSTPASTVTSATTQPEGVMSFSLTSAAFAANQPIPARYTCDGQDVSPPLAWSGQSATVASYALIVDDPDARGDFTHWVLFNLPSSASALAEGVSAADRPTVGGIQGKNDFGKIGYGGPCPPSGKPHHYRFTLYALDATLGLKPGATKQQVLSAMKGHILAQAQLIGTYQRRG